MVDPKCESCGEGIKPGEGFYHPGLKVSLHYEGQDVDNMPVGTLLIPGKNGSCPMEYSMKSGKPVQFRPDMIEPIGKLDVAEVR